MRHFVYVAAMSGLIAVPGGQVSAQNRGVVSVEQAEQVCLKRAERFARSGYGRDAGYPPPDLIEHRYKLCVYGKSRQDAPRRLRIRGVNISLSQGR